MCNAKLIPGNTEARWQIIVRMCTEYVQSLFQTLLTDSFQVMFRLVSDNCLDFVQTLLVGVFQTLAKLFQTCFRFGW